MPRKKRHTKLPNGYGNISFFGKGRRRPYAVYPPATKRVNGRSIRPPALGYCETYEEGRELLAMYHKGLALPDVPIVPKQEAAPTFAEVYERFYNDKFNNPGKPLSIDTVRSITSAYKNVAELHERTFAEIKYPELQAALDGCPLGYSSVCNIKKLFKGMYAYAEKYELIEKDESRHLQIRKADDNEHGIPFTDDDIVILWREALQNASGAAKTILLMIYSGFRISAYKSLVVRLEPEWYFQGGVKTKAGKDRIVPIHTAIRQFAADRSIYPKPDMSATMQAYLPTIGIATKHTPHDCRHTFSYLCEKYGVPENDRKRLLGHSFGDVTNSVYGHRSTEDLRKSIELIQVPGFVANLLRTDPN